MGFVNNDNRKGSALRSLLLSILSPGLGEIRNGDVGKGFVLTAVRVSALLFPGVYLYSKTNSSFPFCVMTVLVILLTSLYSPFAAYTGVSGDIRGWWRSVPALALWGIIQWIMVIFAAYVCISLSPVIEVKGNQAYPLYPERSILVTSVRASQLLTEGDLVIVRAGKDTVPLRILSSEEGSYAEYASGKISVLGEELPQTVRSASDLEALGFPNDENIYAEAGRSRTYYISRTPAKEKSVDVERFIISKGELLVCPDNRVNGKPLIVRREDVLSRVEFSIPIPWRNVND